MIPSKTIDAENSSQFEGVGISQEAENRPKHLTKAGRDSSGNLRWSGHLCEDAQAQTPVILS